MDIKKHENSNITINLRADKKNYNIFLRGLKELGKMAEFNSNTNKLDYFISTHFQKIPSVSVGGICSRVIEDSGEIFEVLFLDVDNKLRFLLESECKFLMNEYNLSPFYLFTTSEKIDKKSSMPYGNYHAISITKCHYKQILEMQSKVHTLDPAYSVIPKIFKYGTWVLRQSKKNNRDKPHFIKIIGDIEKEYNQNCSNSHKLFIEGVYPEVPKIKYTNLDKYGIDRLFLTEYKTASNIEGDN
jgi:hypothetical protein